MGMGRVFVTLRSAPRSMVRTRRSGGSAGPAPFLRGRSASSRATSPGVSLHTVASSFARFSASTGSEPSPDASRRAAPRLIEKEGSRSLVRAVTTAAPPACPKASATPAAMVIR